MREDQEGSKIDGSRKIEDPSGETGPMQLRPEYGVSTSLLVC